MVIAANRIPQPPTTPPGQNPFAKSLARIDLMVRATGLPPLKLLTTKQAAELLGICEITLREWARRGFVDSIKIGRRRWFTVFDLCLTTDSLQSLRAEIEEGGVESFCEGDPEPQVARALAEAAMTIPANNDPDDDDTPEHWEP